MATHALNKPWRAFWMFAASVATVAILAWILVPPRREPATPVPPAGAAEDRPPVSAVGSRRIAVNDTTPLARNLQRETVTAQRVSFPLLTVTGSVVARIRPGDGPIEERWQFFSAELSTTYAEWLKARADVEFARTQLEKTRELVEAQESRHATIVARLKSLAGTVPTKDLATAEADLIQSQIQGQKDVFAAESALRVATRLASSLERQLAQGGVEPAVLARARDGMVLISANVPESKISLVVSGQSCEARFFGFPGDVYSAHVEELGSILSSERRTLRVLFDLSDDKDRLRPGMFAEVGLGTEPREAILIPTAAVIHIGRADYVLVQESGGATLEVRPVELTQARGTTIEVAAGLVAGDVIVTDGAILLKPVMIQSLSSE